MRRATAASVGSPGLEHRFFLSDGIFFGLLLGALGGGFKGGVSLSLSTHVLLFASGRSRLLHFEENCHVAMVALPIVLSPIPAS